MSVDSMCDTLASEPAYLRASGTPPERLIRTIMTDAVGNLTPGYVIETGSVNVHPLDDPNVLTESTRVAKRGVRI